MEKNYFCEGVDKAPQRSLFNALGLTKEEMERPMVGIVSSYNEIVPGHMNIDKIGIPPDLEMKNLREFSEEEERCRDADRGRDLRIPRSADPL